MKRISSLGMGGLLAALAIGMAGCGSPSPEIPAPPSPPQEPTHSDTANGVTTPVQLFGAACGQLPRGGTPGSPDRLASQPVITGLDSNPVLQNVLHRHPEGRLGRGGGPGPVGDGVGAL
jgi:hypothetical protein